VTRTTFGLADAASTRRAKKRVLTGRPPLRRERPPARRLRAAGSARAPDPP
jgi:hypothetical protein